MYTEDTITTKETLPTNKEELIQIIKTLVLDNAMFKVWEARIGINFDDFSIVDGRGYGKKGQPSHVPYTKKGTHVKDENYKGFYCVNIYSDTRFTMSFDDLEGDLL